MSAESIPPYLESLARSVGMDPAQAAALAYEGLASLATQVGAQHASLTMRDRGTQRPDGPGWHALPAMGNVCIWTAPGERTIEVAAAVPERVAWFSTQTRLQEIVVVEDREQLPPEAHLFRDQLRDWGIRSCLGVNIRLDGSPVGGLVISRTQAGPWSPEDQQWVILTSKIAALQLGILAGREALAQATSAADSVRTSQAEFFEAISHELKTPLNAMLGYANMLEQDFTLMTAEEVAADAAAITKSGRYLDRVLTRLMSEATSIHQGEGEPAVACLATAVDDVLNWARADAESAGISVSADGNFDDTVVIQPTLLARVLSNLVQNAIRYNRAGGSVRVTSTRLHRRGRDHVIVRVTDTGRGLSDRDIQDIWQPYVRLANDVDGTGLGLVFAKNLVELAGGRIGVDSELGVGSTFWVELPAADLKPQDVGPVRR